jgi:Phosphotransferase enzyme family
MKSSLGKLRGKCRNGVLKSSCRDCPYNAIRKDEVDGGRKRRHQQWSQFVKGGCCGAMPCGRVAGRVARGSFRQLQKIAGGRWRSPNRGGLFLKQNMNPPISMKIPFFQAMNCQPTNVAMSQLVEDMNAISLETTGNANHSKPMETRDSATALLREEEVRPAHATPNSPDESSATEDLSEEENFLIWYAAVRPLDEQLKIARDARDGTHTCSFGTRTCGGYNVASTLVFDDGVEWIVKAPKYVDEEACKRLESEIATLMFLASIDGLLVPRIYAYSSDDKNPAHTPYIMMEKVGGQTLHTAMNNGLDRAGVFRTLEGLANFRKALQQHPSVEVGSFVLDYPDPTDTYVNPDVKEQDPADTEIGYFLAELMNMWTVDGESIGYRSSSWESALEYYFNQHNLAWIVGYKKGNTREERAEVWLAHQHIGSLLPAYAQPSPKPGVFYLAHTDLSMNNLLVDSDGTVTGVIDWEYANTLPPQVVEHYPVFLAKRKEFVENFKDKFDDPNQELDIWRAHYAKQFNDPETVAFHDRIDTIISFENLLRNIDQRSVAKICEVVKALDAANALYAPLPEYPWNTSLSCGETVSTEAAAVNRTSGDGEGK